MRINFCLKMKKWRKNDHVRSSLAGTLSNGIKVMELLEFHEKKQDFAPDPNPNEQNPFFLEKNKSCLAVGFLKNQSIWLKKTVFSKKVGKSHRLGESRKPGGFLFPENQAISSSGFNKFASRYSLHAHFIIIHADCGVHSIFRFSFLDT